MVKVVIKGTQSVLHHSGLGHEWWKEAMQAFCCGRNFTSATTGVTAQDPDLEGQTAHEVRFGESFRGKLIPFGARIFWKCLNPDINKESAKFEEPTREGLFM